MISKNETLNEIYLRAKRARLVLSKEEFASKLGYSRSHMHRFMVGSETMPDGLVEKAESFFPISNNDTTIENHKSIESTTVDNDKLAVFLKLAEGNRLVAEGNATATRSNEMIAKSLTEESLENREDFNSDVLEAVAPLVRGLMIAMAQMGVDGKCWTTLQEGLEKLHTIVYGHAFGDEQESIAVEKRK